MNRRFEIAAELVNVAVVTTLRGASFCRPGSRPIGGHVEEFWRATKQRQANWATLLHSLEREADASHRLRPSDVDRLQGLAEELLASDILVRLWSALVRSVATGPCEGFVAFAQSALLGQLDARNRLLRLLVRTGSIPSDVQRQLDQLRRHAERWTDLLLGYLPRTIELNDLAFEIERVEDFTQSFQYGGLRERSITETLMMESVLSNARRMMQAKCPNPTLNRRIAQSVLVALGVDLLETTGVDADLWQMRLRRNLREVSIWLHQMEREFGGNPTRS